MHFPILFLRKIISLIFGFWDHIWCYLGLFLVLCVGIIFGGTAEPYIVNDLKIGSTMCVANTVKYY